MKKIIFCLAALLSIFCFCNFKKPGKLPFSDTYKEYDLFTLKGKNPVYKKDEFPFVTIHKYNDSLVIVHHLSDIDLKKSVYLKKNDKYERVLKSSSERINNETKEIITNDSVISFRYDLNTGKKRLSAISLYTGNTITVYSFLEEYFDIELNSNEALTFIKTRKKSKIHFSSFEQTNSEITVDIANRYSTDTNYFYRKQFKFKNDINHSIEWWFIYKWKLYDNPLLLHQGILASLGVDESEL
jgi:hypothetical protein